jgi:mono/diheme cytochrome c family protein
VDAIEVASGSWFDGEMLRKFSLLTILVSGLTPAYAADPEQGKTIADRWCSSCHVVEHEQKAAATDQAPPFVTIGKTPNFNADKLALLLLKPHPNMPKLELSRSEVADLAEYIRTMSR